MVNGTPVNIYIEEEYSAGQNPPGSREDIYSAMIIYGLLSYFSGGEIGERYHTGEAVLVVVFQNGQLAVVDIMEVGSHLIAVFVQSSVKYYMTGVLPIKKYSTGSALNMFDEYTMLKDRSFEEYFGFSDEK